MLNPSTADALSELRALQVAWRDVPERYGPWATLHTRFRRWAKDGTFEQMLREAQAQADAAGDIDWLVSVDSTIVRAHHNAAGARKGAPGTRTVAWQPDQQDSFGLRCLRPPSRLRGHGRQQQRLHPVHRGHGSDPGAPHRPGPPPDQAVSCHRRQTPRKGFCRV
ncbi:transposase [Streptomyces rapamycinicus]|uniref:Transposase n=1 Tax=Streptomyces rhizosphaericus TaxID=114699 RepID=A0A6G4AH77_9ACTN|nr:transposase [Streptomyces rhizosphaericus]